MTQNDVDVDEIVMKYLSQWEESVGWFDSCEEPPYFKQLITGAITEALRGSYTREDMRKYAIGFLDSIRDYERENGQRICFDERESSELLDQYDTERGKSNG